MTITRLMSLQQAADYIGVSRSTARRYVDREINPLPVRIIGKRKMFKRQDLDEWKEAEECEHLKKKVGDLMWFVAEYCEVENEKEAREWRENVRLTAQDYNHVCVKMDDGRRDTKLGMIR